MSFLMPSGCISRSLLLITVYISVLKSNLGVESAVSNLNAVRMLSSPLACSSFNITFLICVLSERSSRSAIIFLVDVNIPLVVTSTSLFFTVKV